MRRILAAATLGVALFSAAACSDTPANPTAAATSAAATVDKTTACANLMKATTDFKTKLIAAMPKLLDAAGDQSKAQAVVTEMLAAMKDFATAYGKDVASIADPELKAAVEADLKALSSATTALTAAGADATKIDAAMSSPEFEKAGETVEKLCKV